MKDWKLDLSKTGYNRIFKDYQKEIIDFLLESTPDTYSSREVHENLLENGITISRASVINYLDFLVEKGICDYEGTTGKGGHFRLYKITDEWDEIKAKIFVKLFEGAADTLGYELDGITDGLL